MQVQVHSDHRIEGSARLVEWVTQTVNNKLDRFSEDLTRVLVQLNDENGERAGPDDKRCQIEARPKGQQPVSVSQYADNLEQALDGALEKLHNLLTSQQGKQRTLERGRERGAKIEEEDEALE